MSHKLVIAIRTVAAVAWGLAAVDLIPWGWGLPDKVALFTIAVACVSTYALISHAYARPIDELYRAGKVAGRLEAQAESRHPSVSSLSERRALRIVSKS